MTVTIIDKPFPVFTDLEGKPLDDGYIYIGTVNQNPETNPITVYWDNVGLSPAAQPIRTLSGYASRYGTPTALYVGSQFSIAVKDKNGVIIFYKAQSDMTLAELAASSGASLVGFLQAGAGAVPETVETVLRRFVFADQFADGGGLVDATAGLTAALAECIATGKNLWGNGTFLISGSVPNWRSVRKSGPGRVKVGTNYLPFADFTAFTPVTLYHDPVAGDDANIGLGSGSLALKTIQACFDTIPEDSPGTWTINSVACTAIQSLLTSKSNPLLRVNWNGAGYSAGAPTTVIDGTGLGAVSGCYAAGPWGLTITNVKFQNFASASPKVFSGLNSTWSSLHSVNCGSGDGAAAEEYYSTVTVNGNSKFDANGLAAYSLIGYGGVLSCLATGPDRISLKNATSYGKEMANGCVGHSDGIDFTNNYIHLRITEGGYSYGDNCTFDQPTSGLTAVWIDDGGFFETGTNMVYSTAVTWPVFSTFPHRKSSFYQINYYVNASTGNDGNQGLTSGSAFKTIQRAIDIATNRSEPGVSQVIINVADGTYAGFSLRQYSGGNISDGTAQFIILGNASTPANVVISTTGSNAVQARNVTSPWLLNGMRIQTATSGYGLYANNSVVNFLNVDFGVCVAAQIAAENNANITAVGNYSISGGSTYHLYLGYGSVANTVGRTVTISGTPAFSIAYAYATMCAVYLCSGMTFSGSATGAKYAVVLNAVINSGGGTLPGGSAGSTATGGQYA